MRSDYQNFKAALKNVRLPCLLLDLEAFEKNIQWALASTNKNIRIATKSIRSVEILRKILAASDRFQGLMCYTLSEALWLRSLGFNDILMGYPTTDQEALLELASKPQGICLMVDLPEHIDILEALKPTTPFEIALDLDLSLDLPRLRFGVFRSAIQDLKSLNVMLDKISQSKHVHLKGVMGYEAQIAGVKDKGNPVIQGLKKLSLPKVKKRRHDVVQEIKKRGFQISLVNGGGTGSLKTTSQEKVVTEVTVGSGFFAPHLFDHYMDFKLSPALMFALPIVRHPSPQIYTALGGGFVASGALEALKLPRPYLPIGMKLLKHEGAGEVQTPLAYAGKLAIGDPVIFRHAKSGEPCEHFLAIHLIKQNTLMGTVPTYRGEGKAFL